ncbi:MAG: Vitamin B12 transporter BtuB [Myxococcota bacterium]|nr:Vitamin B12 transporter BtuB [Myxococcota bacterium]
MTHCFCIAGACLLLLPALARADDAGAASPGAAATPIRVRSALDRGFANPDFPSANVTIIDINERRGEARSAAQFVEESAGTSIQSLGGPGAFSTVSIRGSNADQVRVYLNGAPLNRASGGAVNLADIPVEALERIEVYRGFTPPGLAEPGLAGAINLVTRSADAGSYSELLLSGGSFFTRRISGARTQHFPAWNYGLFLGHEGSAGDYSFLDDNGTPFNTADDAVTRRENNHNNAFSATGRVSARPTRLLELDLTSDFFTRRQGLPGVSSNQAREADFSTLRATTQAAARFRPLASDDFTLELAAHHGLLDERLNDARGEIALGGLVNNNLTHAAGLTSRAHADLARGISCHGMLDWRMEIYQPRNLQPPEKGHPSSSRHRLSAAAWQQLAFFNGGVVFTPALRWDAVFDRFSGEIPLAAEPVARSSAARNFLSPSAGARVNFPHGFFARANLGQYARFPSMFELFGDRGYIGGNPALRPEIGLNQDIGVGYDSGRRLGPGFRVYAEAAAFRTIASNLIQYVQFSQRNSRAVNIGGAAIPGWELQASLNLTRHFQFAGNHTRQLPQDLSADAARFGMILPRRPMDETFLRPRVLLPWTRLQYEFRYTGLTFLDPANRRFNEARVTHGALVSVQPGTRHARITFEAQNFTANRVADFDGFPLPGRIFMVSLFLHADAF